MDNTAFNFAPQAPAPIPAMQPGSFTDLKIAEPAPPTPEQVAAAKPEPHPAEVPPTPEEIAAATPVDSGPPTAAQVAAATKDYTRDDVLRTPASELMADASFKPEQWAVQHPEDSTDPKVLPVLAEVFRQRRIAPTTISDVGTGLAGIPGVAHRFGSALWERARNLHDIVLGGDTQSEKAMGEFKAGMESAAVGMGGMVRGAVNKFAHDNPLARALPGNTDLDPNNPLPYGTLWENMTPEQVQRHFLDAAAIQKQEQAIGAGEGVWQNITGFGAADLAKRGITLDPERIASLAMTDPVTFVAFGEGFKIVNAATGAALGFARTIPLAEKAIDIAKSAVPKVVGGGLQAGGAAVRGVGATVSAAAPIARTLGPVAVIGKAAVEGQVPSFGEVLGGLKAGEAFSQTGEGLTAAGKRLGEIGRQFTGAAPAGTAVRRIVDLGNASATALGEVGKGAALGGAIGATTGETPEDVSGQIAMGGAFGLLPATKAGLGKVVAGEMVTPKGTPTPKTPSPGYGTLPALDAITKTTLDGLPEDRRNKINFVRELGRKLGAQIYVYGTPEQGAQMIGTAKPGISEAAASDAAAHNGFTLDVNGKPIIFLNGSASAEGHELGHALEKALSPEQNAKLDAATRANFSEAEWNDMGQRYTSRLLNRELGPKEDWRSALAPHTGGLSPDQYMLRENRADNFDELWRNRGTDIGKPEDVYRRIVGALGRGAESVGVPLVEAKDFSGNPISLRSQKSSESALGTIVPPKAGAPVPTVTPKGGPAGTLPKVDPVTKARDFITNNPTDIPERNAGVSDLLDAAQSGGGVRVLYWGAKGDPAGSVTSVRPERRAEIEAQRGAENSKRQLMEKEIFPYKVDNTSKGPQIVGWSPDNFDANAEKLAEWAGQLTRSGTDVSGQIPYGLDAQKGRFTAAGRAELLSDAQKFMRNQRAGFTGAGEPVIVPRETAARGYHEPVRTGAAPEPLPQDRADIINYLFHVQIPDTATRVAPLHLAAQEVATATGRAPIPPIRPRGEYTEAQLTKAGLESPRAPMEVNPFRQWVEQTAQQSGVSRPSLIDVSQRLNVGHIEKTVPSLRTEPFNGNTLTLAAGFQPKAEIAQPERIASMSPDEFSKWSQGLPRQSFTQAAYDLGDSLAGNTEAIAKLDQHYADLKQKAADLMSEGNLQDAITTGYQGQFFREASEKATNTGSAATFEGRGQAQPPARNADVSAVAEDYAKSARITLRPSNYAALDEARAKRIADYYAAAQHDPKNTAVKSSYDALAKETEAQYKAIEAAGYTLEPFTGTGEPYKSSADMQADVADNKHLYYLPSASASDASADNLMMSPSGIEGKPVNDIFRAVHDFFGHAKEGYQFGPRGEYNAWREHSQMYSPEAQGALAAETLAQNAWVNFGPHLRDATGNVAAKGQPGFVPPTERPFAEQKNIVVPPEVAGSAQPKFDTPEVEDELNKVRSGKSDGQTFNPDGSAFVPPPDKKLDVVTLASVNVPIAELTPERVQSFLAPYAEALGHDGVKAGVFKMADGRTASIDLNAVVDQAHRDNSVAFAKANDQQAIFDLHKFENVDTGGAGNTVLRSPEQIAAALPNLLSGQPVDVSPERRRRTTRGSSWWMRQADVSGGGQAQPRNNDPEAVARAAIRTKDGQVFRGALHGYALENAKKAGADTAGYEQGFITNSGEFLNRKQAQKRAEELGQLPPDSGMGFSGKEGLDSSTLLESQAQPKRRDEYTMLPGSPGGFSNAWILPGGKVEQLGGMWHHHWLAEDEQGMEAAKKAGLNVPPFEGVDAEGVRESAIRAGFARIKLDRANGIFTVEARAADWARQKVAVQKMVEANLDGIDNLRVHLLNRNADDIVDSKNVPLFQMDTDAEKLAAIPFMSGAPAEARARVRATDNPAFRAPEEPAAPLPQVYGAPVFKVFDSAGKFLNTAPNYDAAESQAKAIGGKVDVSRSFSGQAQPKLSEEPEAIKEAAVKYGNEIYTGATHSAAAEKVRKKYGRREAISSLFGRGFVTNEGKFLDQEAAMRRAKEYGQVPDDYPFSYLESTSFDKNRGTQFQPTNPRTAIKYFTGEEKSEVAGTGFRGRPTLWDAAKFLSEPNAKLGKLGRESESDLNEHAAAIADEAEFALQRDPSAVGWYDDKITKMQKALEGLHPELQTDPNKFMVYKALLAINSNGQPIDTNLARSEMLYSQWKANGTFDTAGAFGGKNAPAINIGLRNLSDLITARGLDGAREFLDTDYTVGDLKKMGFAVPGELNSTKVKGSVILGPKIGSFYGNLNGDYSSVTMDRWFMRTFNRIGGTLTAPLSAPLPRQISNVLDAFKGRRSDMGHDLRPIRESLNEALSGLKSKTMEPEEMQDKNSLLGQWLYDRFRTYEGSRFADRSPQNVSVKNLYENLFGTEAGEKPGSGSDRAWIRRVISEAQRQLRERGINLTNADLQALLWYYEKELYARHYPQNKRGVPTDYARAAERFVAEQRGQQPGQDQPGPGPSGLVEPRALAK